MSFVKSQILNQLAKTYSNFLRKDLERALDLIFNEIIKTLSEEKNFQVRGFGSFKIKNLKYRIGRNPKDGSRVEIPAKKGVKFKMSKNIFQKLNQNINENE